MGFDQTFQQLVGAPGLQGPGITPHAATPVPDGVLLDQAAALFMTDEAGVDLTVAGLHELAATSQADAVTAFAQAATLTGVINRAAASATGPGAPLTHAGVAGTLWARLTKVLHQLQSLAVTIRTTLGASVTITVGAPWALSLAITF